MFLPKGLELLFVSCVILTVAETVFGETCPDGLPCDGGVCCRKLFLGRSHDCCRSGYRCMRILGIGICVVSGAPEKNFNQFQSIPEESNIPGQDIDLDSEKQEKDQLEEINMIKELANQIVEEIIATKADEETENQDTEWSLRRGFFKKKFKLLKKVLKVVLPLVLKSEPLLEHNQLLDQLMSAISSDPDLHDMD